MIESEYDDLYGTCHTTYASLLIYHDHIDIPAITEALGFDPTYSQVKGETTTSRYGSRRVAPIGLWSLSSDGLVMSRDSRRHIDWLLGYLEGTDHVFEQLRASGHRIEMSCYWVSAEGHGGPTLPPSMMKRLGELGIELWFDFYGPYPADDDDDDD